MLRTSEVVRSTEQEEIALILPERVKGQVPPSSFELKPRNIRDIRGINLLVTRVKSRGGGGWLHNL